MSQNCNVFLWELLCWVYLTEVEYDNKFFNIISWWLYGLLKIVKAFVVVFWDKVGLRVPKLERNWVWVNFSKWMIVSFAESFKCKMFTENLFNLYSTWTRLCLTQHLCHAALHWECTEGSNEFIWNRNIAILKEHRNFCSTNFCFIIISIFIFATSLLFIGIWF